MHAQTSGSTHLAAKALAPLVVLVGLAAIIRLKGLGSFNLWHDEAWVAVSVTQTGFQEMFFFEYPQTTPPLLLILIRSLTTVLGPDDWVLRFWPALAGIATTAFIYVLCQKLTASKLAALISAALWAVNPVVLRYSQELKQYATDALVGLLLILMTERAISRGKEEGVAPRLLGLTVLAVILMGFSHTSVFFIATVGVRLAWHLRVGALSKAETRRAWGQWIGFSAATGLTFLLIQQFIVRPQITDWLVEFWRDSYVRITTPAETLALLLSRSYGFFWYLFGDWSEGILFQHVPFLFWLVFMVGVLGLFFSRRRLCLFYLLTPIVLTVLAAAFHQYPYGGIRVRADFFLVPLLFIGIAYGFDRIISMTKAGPRLSSGLALLPVLLFLYLQFVENEGSYSKRNEDIRSAVRTVSEHFAEGDRIGVHPAGYYAFRHYGRGTTEGVFEVGSFDDSDLASAEQDIKELADSLGPGGNLWLVFSRDRGGHRDAYRNIADRRCDLTEDWEFEEAAVFRFRCEGSGY